MMSKKHYVAIAREFHTQRNGAALESAAYQRGFSNAQYSLASALATVFASENPNFDRARFLKACGLGG